MRVASFVLAVVAAVLPTAWAYLSARTCTGGAPHCGLRTGEVELIAALTAALISSAAVICSVLAYRQLPRPRPMTRRLEVLAVSLPLVLALGLVAYIFVAVVAGIGFLIA